MQWMTHQSLVPIFKMPIYKIHCWENYIIFGPEFGLDNEGKIEIIIRSLYRRTSDGDDYWHHVQATMADMNF